MMKQSTSFAQVATNLLNVLQGYTKGIRFVAVLTMLLTVGIGQAWGEMSTITITQSNLGLTGSYTTNTEKTIDGVTFKYSNLMKNSSNIQAQASGGEIYNSTAIPGNIVSIAVTHSGTARSSTIYFGTSAKSTTEESSTFSGTKTIEPTSDYQYFYIKRGSNAAYWTQIVITYETSNSGDGNNSGDTNCLTLSATSNYPFNSNSSSNTSVSSTTIDGITFENKGGYKYNSYLSFNSSLSGAYIANTTPFNGNIESIVVDYNSGGSSYFNMYEGSASKPSSTVVSPSKTGTGSVTYTFSGNNPYFNLALKETGTYCNINSITICYSNTPAPSFTITATSNNNSYGTVVLQGTTITARPETGYRVSTTTPYTISPSNSAKVTQNGNTFTVTPSENTTITIYFEAIPTYTVNWYVNGTKKHTQTATAGTTLTNIPTPTTADCDNSKVFVGWTTTADYSNATTAPSGMITNTSGMTMPEGDENYHAVFATEEDGGGTTEIVKTETFSNQTSHASESNWKQSLTWNATESNIGVEWSTYYGKILANDDYVEIRTYSDKNMGFIWSSQKIKGLKSIQFNGWHVTESDAADMVVSYSKNNDNDWVEIGTHTAGSTSSSQSAVFTIPDAGVNDEYYISIDLSNATCPSSSNKKYRIDNISLTILEGSGSTTSYSDYMTSCTTETAVTLNPNGGTISANGWTYENDVYKLTTEDESITLPEITRAGYTFDGWATAAGGDKVYNDNATINLDGTAVNLYAIWKPITYTITYELDGGTNHASNPAKYTIETEAITLQDPNKTNHNFVGWYKESTFATQVTQIAKGSTGNITLYAKWEEIPTTCTVTYDANGGTGTAPTDNTEYTNGATVTVVGNYGKLTKDGYAFTGWNTESDGSGTPYNAGEKFVITTNTTLHAQWCKAHWILVTDDSKIKDDTRIVIAAKDYDYALSTTQNTNNRGQAEITKTYNTISFTNDVQVIALEKGSIDNTFAFNTGNGYLYAAGANSNNYLKTQNEKEIKGLWEFAIDPTVTAVAVTPTANITRNVLKYNTIGLFSCYESTSTQKDVVIYQEVCVEDQYNVTSNITNATAKTNPTTVAADAESLTLNYSANTGYLLPETIIVKMGGALLVATTDYTWDKATGTLTINVTGFYGDIDVKIVAEADPCYQFEMSEVTATSTTNSITLTWTEVAGATGYNVRLDEGELTTATGFTHTFTGLSPKTTYKWEVQAVSAICEDSKTGSTATQKEIFTVSWSVNGNVTSRELVVDGESIQDTPSTPSNQTLEDCGANKFMGWSEKSAGSTPQDAAYYDDLCTAEDMIEKYPSITSNKTFYAVFATKSSGGGAEIGTVVFSEDFSSFTSGNKMTGTQSSGTGRSIYGSVSVTYSYQNGTSADTKIYAENNAGGTSPELLVGKKSSTFTISGIPSAGAAKLQLSYKQNAKSLTSKVSGTGYSGGTQSSTKQTTSTIITVGSASTFNLTFTGPSGSDNARLDDICITVEETSVSYSNYVTNCCAIAPATNLTVSGTTSNTATLTWTAPSPTTGITKLQVRNADNDAVVVDDIAVATTTATINGLDECTKYNYYVVSVGAECEVSSETITAQPFSGAKTVTFNYNGNGQANTTASTSCGNTSITLPTPTWAGYRFMGWYTAANGGDKVNDNPYTPTSNITLYAQWEKEYNVTYNANGGSTTCANGNYIAGETVTVCTTEPTKNGYSFAGWTYSPELTITDGKFTMPASDVTITAQWIINQYTVTWNPNGGKWGESTDNIVHTYYFGDPVNSPADPTRDGYRFIGWNATVASTMPATNITYTAQWKQNYTITFHDGDDTTPWTQTIDAESIDLNTYVGTHACGEYNFAGWSTASTQYNDQTANITTWVTGTYTPTANIHLYAVYVKGDLATDFTLNCDGGVYEIWEKGHNQHMAGRQNGGGNKFYTTEWYNGDCTSCEGTDGAPFTITKVADNTYTLQNADGQYITGNTYDEDDLNIEDTWENADKYKWTISNGTNGTWRFTNKAADAYALVYYSNYFQLQKATNVTNGSAYYDLELTPAQTNVYQSNPNCGPYTITFETGGGEFVQGNYKYSTAVTSNLTETTTTLFPAAELEGYTFAGWKDGAPQDDVNYEPYLKKADDNLVVSSNKTYYAVYYYYDEEEDIDWSKEFTTAIYADVNGIKYFLSGTPNDGTMSSTTDCGYVSEVTITPGTGANAGKYKITVNGEGMAPEAGETNLVAGTAWWTITETSVGSGEYKISGEDKRNIVLRNSSFGHYSYNEGSSYGAGYYYPRFGKCLEHHWTSNPTPKPSITISGDVYVTATNGRGIMATQSLSVAANNLYAGESLTLSSESSDIYFSAERNVNFVKANKPTASLTLTADATGKIDKEVYVHYKPSKEGDGVPADVVVTATASSVSKNHTIHVRNLPAKFVIATKVGATWYALPADMSSATNPLGVVIEVNETTMTTIAPNTTTYTLWPVKTTATENDRYTNATGNAYGDRVRFAAVNYEQKGLWANNNNNGSTIRNFAVIDALGDDGLAGYEWKITTTVVDGHWQYTLQTDQDQNQNYLRYWTAASGGAKWGTYASGNNQLYFLPVTTYTDLDLEVMEWGTNSMVIRAGEDLPQNVNITINGTTTSKTLQNINGSDLYKIDDVTLTSDDCGTIIIDNGSNARKIIRKPLLVSGNKSGSEYTTSPGRDICAECDIVILNGGQLIADEAKSLGYHVDFANIYVYPGGKLVLDGNSLGVKRQVYLRGGYSWINQTTYDLPEVYVNGDINFNGSGNIIYDYYIQNYKYYQFSLPYQVPLANVTDEAGIDNFPVWVKHYNGALRAADPHATSWEWYPSENGDANAYFKAGEGYIIAAKPRQVGNVANRPLSIIRFPLGNTAFTGAEINKSITTTAHGIDGYKAGTVTANNVGWNFVGNPFLSTWQGDIGHKQLTKYPNEANWDGTYDWVEVPTKYITIMSAESGSDYAQYIASATELKPFFPFYLQETADGGSGTINFATANRVKKAPAVWNVDQEEREAYVQIEIATDAVADQTGVFVGNKYSDDLDFDDYEKMFGTSTDLPKLWIMHDDKRMAFEAMSELKASNATPLGYRAPQEGKYLFDINLDASQLNEVEAIYLTDNETGVTFDLMMGAYEFESSAITHNDTRFLLRIVMKNEDVNEETGIEDIYFNRQQTMKFIHNGIMYIWHDGAIYDATGKQINSLGK